MTEDPRLPTAVLGASGYIGQHFVRMLADHPAFDPPLLVGSSHSDGRALGELWQLDGAPPPASAGATIRRLGPGPLARSGVRVAFSALPSGTAAPFERELARRGVAVFSNAADLRARPGIPLLIPEVNGAGLHRRARRSSGRGPIITNPNCTATGLAMALAPAHRLLDVERVHVATYQSLSGAGLPGVPALAMTDNLIPFIAEEEEKVARETHLLLRQDPGGPGAQWRGLVDAQCVRVGTREGHLEAVTVIAHRAPPLDRLLEAWRAFRPLAALSLPTAPVAPLELRGEKDRPQPLRDRWAGSPDRARGMTVTLGRVRWEPPVLRFFLLVHNAVRGGAGGSILNAEFARTRGWL